MKKIAIVGNSLMSIAAIEEIRSVDQESKITLFCPEGILPYDRVRLPSVLSEQISLEDIYCKAQSYFDEKRVNVVLNKKIVKVHPKRKRVVFEDKEQEPFDVLMIEDSGSFEPSGAKSAKKQGVFTLYAVSDIEEISKAAPLCDVIVIQPNNLLMLEAAVYLRKFNKEVIVVCSDDSLLSSVVGKSAGDFLAKRLREFGIRVILNNAIAEVLGESEAKAIRLKTGKVLESQVIILGEVKKNLLLLSIDETLVERNDFYTKFEDIFINSAIEILSKEQAVEDVKASDLSLGDKGKMVGAAVTGHQQSYQQAFKKVIFSLGDLKGCVLGSLENENAIEYERIDRPSKTYKKIFVADNVITGAVLINLDQEVAQIEDVVKNKINISQLSSHVLELDQSNEPAQQNSFQSNSLLETEQIPAVDKQQNPVDMVASSDISEVRIEDSAPSAEY
ncbi:MAG: FAD-dependent oxidoreductase [Candidatus Aceula lacicola]|nr:FAD-dependent oxidoreductase [Candidatus Aceula lacicola]